MADQLTEPTDTALADAPGTEGIQDGAAEALDADLVVEDLLVEEISIDGMCGVY